VRSSMAADATRGFETLRREHSFKTPSANSSTAPILHELVAPHIESFNSLFDDSGLPDGDGTGEGLLSLALKDIGSRVVFDGAGKVGESSGQAGWGNKLECEHHQHNRISGVE
jgi:DNA-directed RNA polymerase I subunit RPA2